jgi:transcription antitermination factor NusG
VTDDPAKGHIGPLYLYRYMNCQVALLRFIRSFPSVSGFISYRGADKSLARQGRKQATATEHFDIHISYL